jgi:hypothetical protein
MKYYLPELAAVTFKHALQQRIQCVVVAAAIAVLAASADAFACSVIIGSSRFAAASKAKWSENCIAPTHVIPNGQPPGCRVRFRQGSGAAYWRGENVEACLTQEVLQTIVEHMTWRAMGLF